MPRTTVIQQNPRTRLTQFDSIRYTPGAMPTLNLRGRRNAGAMTSLRTGNRVTVVNARPRTNARADGEAGVALPRRDYGPVVS